MDVAVTGASGLIGTSLVTALRRAGHQPVRLVRRAPDAADEIAWDPVAGTIDSASLEGVDAVVHLAGAGIGDHRWTDAYKRELVESRTVGTAVVARALAALSNPPRVLLSGSAIGIYGDRGDEELTETSTLGTGFLAEVCKSWEAATAPASDAGIRVAHLRTGVVLAASGGALRKQLPLFKLGLGGKLGSGRQWRSWISLDDAVGAIIHLLSSSISGAVNVTAPNPVTEAQFAKTLAAVLHRPAFLPIPSFGPKLVLGAELAENLLFTGQRVLPAVLSADTALAFRHPSLDEALRSLLAPASSAA